MKTNYQKTKMKLFDVLMDIAPTVRSLEQKHEKFFTEFIKSHFRDFCEGSEPQNIGEKINNKIYFSSCKEEDQIIDHDIALEYLEQQKDNVVVKIDCDWYSKIPVTFYISRDNKDINYFFYEQEY